MIVHSLPPTCAHRLYRRENTGYLQAYSISSDDRLACLDHARSPPVPAARRQRIETYLDRLYGYAISLAHDREVARDLVQDCVVRALGARRVPEDESAYRAWLFRILRNRFLDTQRRKGRQVLEQTEDHANGGSTPPTMGERPLIDSLTVRRGLSRLSPAHREILALIDIAGFSYAETASLLQVPNGTVMSRLSRARAALLTAIEDDNVIPLRPRNGRSVR